MGVVIDLRQYRQERLKKQGVFIRVGNDGEIVYNQPIARTQTLYDAVYIVERRSDGKLYVFKDRGGEQGQEISEADARETAARRAKERREMMR